MTHDNSKKLALIDEVGFSKYFRASTWDEYNRKFFDGLAEKYDATNIMHSFGTKNIIDSLALGKIPVPHNAKILDICTGSGDIAIKLAEKYPDSKIEALDASEEMLRVARKKSAGFNNINYLSGDALNLPFDDNTFDFAIISFGLRNLTNLEQGLKEMQRVVKPGGYICNIDQGKPENWLFNIIYNVHFKHIAPILGKLVFHRGEFNSFSYLPASNKYFPEQKTLVNIMQNLGFNDVRNYNYWFGAIAQQVALV